MYHGQNGMLVCIWNLYVWKCFVVLRFGIDKKVDYSSMTQKKGRNVKTLNVFWCAVYSMAFTPFQHRTKKVPALRVYQLTRVLQLMSWWRRLYIGAISTHDSNADFQHIWRLAILRFLDVVLVPWYSTIPQVVKAVKSNLLLFSDLSEPLTRASCHFHSIPTGTW